ncbi:MAG: TlpA family protein disulfide reductase [Caulobacterales bacterium]
MGVGINDSRWAVRGVAFLAIAAALYVIPGCSAKPGADLKALATGDMAKLEVASSPAVAPQIPFVDDGGRSHTLSDFKGKAVVLNIWATWCTPCVAEMGSLAKLQASRAGQPIQVVAISLDRAEDVAAAKRFIAKRAPLGFYSDSKYALAYAFNPPLAGVPTTVLIDRNGVVRARLSGGADWSGVQAGKVIDALLARS